MEDWDLQAIVRGCSKGNSTKIEEFEAADSDFYSLHRNDNFGEFSYIFPEFEGLCNQFKPVFYPNNSPSISLIREFQEPKKLHHKNQTAAAATKLKPSKKSRQNRVIKEVKAEEISSDSWAWRKYGQKPIKGSPHPRSYYRCSSSKGCCARKQVEKSLSDPRLFIVTYTADHNHPQPTRRNALAGSSRKKFPNNDIALVDGSPSSPTSASTEDQELMNLPFEFSSDDDVFSGLEELLYG